MTVYLLIRYGGDAWEDVISVHKTHASARRKQFELARPKYREYLYSGMPEACRKRPEGHRGTWYESEPLHLKNFMAAYFIEEQEVLD